MLRAEIRTGSQVTVNLMYTYTHMGYRTTLTQHITHNPPNAHVSLPALKRIAPSITVVSLPALQMYRSQPYRYIAPSMHTVIF